MSDVVEPFVYKLGVKVPFDVAFVIVHHSVTILPDRVFESRRQLKNVQLLEGIEEIGWRAFADCISLARITCPSTLTKIVKYAFYGCRSLKEVQLPDGLQEIRKNAFAWCISLERINYPSALIKIGHGAFAYCRSLKEATLPEGLEEIRDGAFYDCHSLTKVTLMGGIVTIVKGAFEDCDLLEGVAVSSNAFVVEVDSDGDLEGDSDSDTEVFTCRLVIPDDGTTDLSNATQIIISPERLNYISLPDLLEIENTINTIMNGNERTTRENIERVLALIKSRALIEVSTILELALWKNTVNEIDVETSRAECLVTCGSDDIIPGVMSYL